LGLRSIATLASSALLSSSSAVRGLVHSVLPLGYERPFEQIFDNALLRWQSLGGCSEPLAPLSFSQRHWDNQICSAQLTTLLAAADVGGSARLLASSSPSSGTWLNFLPSPNLGLRLCNEELRLAVGLRLGVPLVLKHLCVCGSPVSINGFHRLSCRHSAINGIIARAFRLAETPVALEPCGLLRGDGKRPDGVTLVPWSYVGFHLSRYAVGFHLSSCGISLVSIRWSRRTY